MLEEKEIIDAITFRDTGHIEVRHATLIIKGGVEIARTYQRHVVEPGQDTAQEDAKVDAIAKALWTPELIADHRKRVDDQVAAVAQAQQPSSDAE